MAVCKGNDRPCTRTEIYINGRCTEHSGYKSKKEKLYEIIRAISIILILPISKLLGLPIPIWIAYSPVLIILVLGLLICVVVGAFTLFVFLDESFEKTSHCKRGK